MGPDSVVVTGIGMVTPLGATARESGDAWRAGLSARRAPLPELAGRIERAEAAVTPQFDPAQRLGSSRMLKYMSDAAVLGCVAAREAAQEADLRRRFTPERVGLYAATGLAAAAINEALPMITQCIDESGRFSCRLLGESGLAAANPLLSFKILANMPPCIVSIQENIKGPNYIFTPWEGQAAAALTEAWTALRRGEVDCALTGAADSASHPATFVYLRQSGLLRQDEYPASAAAYLVMERADTARRDGKRVYAHVENMELHNSDRPVNDPLSARMGRSFAAAPAVLVALACHFTDRPITMTGADRQEFHAVLRRAG